MDGKEAFTDKAGHYAAGRPGYAPALFDALYDRCGFSEDSVIADVGTGTGLFARGLLARGSRVLGVEPNAAMRGRAQTLCEEYPSFALHTGDAAATGLDAGSVDFVTAAQAFHWFDPAAFAAECRRILRPEGKVLLVWNLRDMDSDVNRDLYTVNSFYCPDFHGFTRGFRRGDGRIAEFFAPGYEELSFPAPLELDCETFVRWCLSSSYAPREGNYAFGAYRAAVGDIFERYSKDGVLTVANDTVAYFGSVGE